VKKLLRNSVAFPHIRRLWLTYNAYVAFIQLIFMPLMNALLPIVHRLKKGQKSKLSPLVVRYYTNASLTQLPTVTKLLSEGADFTENPTLSVSTNAQPSKSAIGTLSLTDCGSF
jgi:hypothetical protein